jgi:hypothetical protein
MAETATAYAESPDSDARRAADLLARVGALVGRLQLDADDRVNKRINVEKRWIEDLLQYYGRYDEKTLKDLTTNYKSKVFLKKTRAKTNSCEARIADMLFPTDDKNWAIDPTPVPDLNEDARFDAQAIAEQANAVQEKNPEIAGQMIKAGNEKALRAKLAKAVMQEAKDRADRMEDEMDDQLKECLYAIECRKAIRDACIVGTGVMKGPIAHERARRSWKEREVQAEGGGVTKIFELQHIEDPRPAYYHVDYWSFFPDPNATSIEESDGFYERHLMSKGQLRKLAKQPNFNVDAIRRLVRENARQSTPTYISDLRSIMGNHVDTSLDRYHVWEYRGPIEAEEIRDLCECMGDDTMKAAYEEADPLDELSVVIWFCQGEVLSFGINHLDSGEPVYSVFNLEEDDASIWGLGIPYMMRDSQAAINGAWRMILDNGGLSSGPQIEIDLSVVEPADGHNGITSHKLWLRKQDADANKIGFRSYNIESHTAELVAVVKLANEFIDEETNMPLLAQGESGAHQTQTMGGMSILMNATNVVFRRIVKHFDDGITVPNIRRLYDWNMQFSKRQEIKGDYNVVATGSSVLLVREIQSQNLLLMALQFTGHPVLGMLIKTAPLLRQLAKSMMLSADDIVKTDDEIKEDMARLVEVEQAKAEQEKGAPDNSAEIRSAATLQAAQIQATTRLEIARIENETELIKLAALSNMKIEDLKTKLDTVRMQVTSSERKLAAEIAVEARTPSNVGSGGSVSRGFAPAVDKSQPAGPA